MAPMDNAVRGIIQFPYRSQSAGKDYTGVLLELQRHPRTGVYSYILPGGRLDGQSYEDALRREIDEELGLRVKNLGPYYEYIHNGATTRVYIVSRVEAPHGNVRANNSGAHEVHGLGGYNIGSHNKIPDELMVGHVTALKDDLYHPESNANRRKYVPDAIALRGWIGRQTEGLPHRLNGYFNNQETHPGIIEWSEQRNQWSTWEREARNNRGLPPVNRS